jgi:hypothetical protein
MLKVPLLKDFLQNNQWKPGGKIARLHEDPIKVLESRTLPVPKDPKSELSFSLRDWDTWFGNSDESESDEWNDIIEY